MNEDNKAIVKRLIADGIHSGFKKSFKTFAVYLLIGYAFIFALRFISGDFDRDATDGDSRSGLGLHVDAETGCEYLSSIKGGLARRLDKYGNHKGCKQ